MTTYIVSFLLIFILPLTVLTISWLGREWHDQRSEVIATQERSLAAVTRNMNATVQHLLMTTNQMALDPALSPTDQDQYTYGRMDNALVRYDLSSPMIQKTFLYSEKTPSMLYSSDGTYDLIPTLYKYGMVAGSTESNKEVRKLLYSTVPRMIFTPAADGKTDQLTLAVPITNTPGSSPKGMAFYTMSAARLRQEFLDAAAVPNQALMLDFTNGQIVSNTKLAGMKLPPVSRGQNWKLVNQQNKLRVTTAEGSGNLFKVLSVTTPPSPWPPLMSWLLNYWWLFTGLLLAGGILIWYLGRRQYAGIKQLAAVVPQPTGQAPAPAGSEIVQLESAIKAYVANHQATVAQERVRLPLVRNQVLQMLISGRVSDDITVNRLLHLAQVSFFHPNYLIGIMVDGPAVDDQVLAAPVVADSYMVCFVHRTSRAEVIVLINYDRAVDPRVILRQVRDELAVNSRSAMFAGRPVTELASLHDAYIEAVTAQMTNQPTTANLVSFYTVRHDAGEGGPFDMDNELKLSNALAQGNAAMAREAFEALFNLAIQNYRPDTAIDFPMANLISEVLKADYRKYHQVNEELVEKLLNVMSFSELHTILVETIQKLTAPPIDDTPAPADLGAAMRAYISQNASSPTFSLVDVAEKFDLSVPYTSRFVKETTGITFTTFVQELRMARIRTALEQTKAPIKDIVTANGYYDVANFSRKFKKINGVTPTQYRQLHQRAGSKDDDAIL